MATLGRLSRRFQQISIKFSGVTKSYSTINRPGTFNILAGTIACAVGGGLVLYVAHRLGKISAVHAFKPKKREEEPLVRAVKPTSRERRFIKFASAEYNGQLYMTPQDFLESVVEQEPRPRLKRRILTDKDLENIRDKTPALRQGSSQMFRTLRDKGIISYTEYLFLLSILTKPQTGFRIAFNMFDTDGNERVDKTEFLVIQRIMAKNMKEQYENDASLQTLMKLVAGPMAVREIKKEIQSTVQTQNTPTQNQTIMEKIFSHAWKGKRGIADVKEDPKPHPIHEDYVDDEQGLQRRHLVDTTLIIHFFGKKGKDELRYEGFKKFMENLQKEVLELEFHEFSKGHDTITEVDFAKILLRYTYLDTDEYDMYLDRLLTRIKEEKGITFEEFHAFCQFLNNLEDFTIAMRMYTLADHPISKDEFHRAVKICTGTNLSRHLVHIVFQIFDEDGDGQLSYREFIAIMKDRLHRGFKSYAKNEGWEAFKNCVKNEMKAPV
ncbi:calcium uptake protein 3, mitochondrial isoform X1 [Schistocerca cancellata]|uniref:calcium uptake protein 3, mitochondrial isoform X1 n=1 Tax=Schistocerca cancellata TaxID=274614 RepID=UPI002118DB3E|nr:calcium uptake protein 3, mitochondrial isoform X1 [Schistocerca cancellata]